MKEKVSTIKRTSAMKKDPGEETKDDDEGPEVESVQQFVMTASGPNKNINPREQREFVSSFSSQVVDLRTSIASWFTNPQTEAFCALIEVENKVNPVPVDFVNAASGTSK